MAYRAPLEDIRQALAIAADLNRFEGSDAFPAFDGELVDPILEEAGKLASEVLAPLNQVGDRHGAQLTEKGVVAAPGFADAYKVFREGGWMGLSFPEEFGGQGLPRTLALAVLEMVHASNMAFGLCPMLTFGAIEAIIAHGTDEQKSVYAPKLISGEWTGTMNLTEPQAGSDVGALKTRATPQGDGSYLIEGQKIYITWGDHDMADNIVHLVLARLPDAPEGSRGVSLFVVPKFIPDANGNPGERNDVHCIGLEKKLGIHASPTCVMEYGAKGGARGWLIGEENRGLACMFTMMNSARLNVGLEGVAVGDAAYQAAYTYAQERKQGKAPSWKGEGPAPIVHHADVRRTLLTMRARVMAARAICFATGMASDLSESAPSEEERASAKLREELLTPIAKAWSTDMGVGVASLGVQIHGGMGFMNDTAASQFYRDARIAPIYEGTNGIQAIDLVGRKLTLGNGAAMDDLMADIDATIDEIRRSNHPQLVSISKRLTEGRDALASATDWMTARLESDRETALAGATPYLELAGDVVGGYFLARSAMAAQKQLSASDTAARNATAHLALAGFFAETVLASAPGKVAPITTGSDHVLIEEDALFEIG